MRRKSRTERRGRQGHQAVEAQAVNAQPRPGRVPIGAGKGVIQDKGPTGAIGGIIAWPFVGMLAGGV